jgi:hypothetical protein
MEEERRLTLEEIDARHPQLLSALRAHPHIGWVLVVGRARRWSSVPVEPAISTRTAWTARIRLRSSRRALRGTFSAPTFEHAPDVLLGSFTTRPSTRDARSRS